MQILSLKQIIAFKIVLNHTEGMQQFKLDQPPPPPLSFSFFGSMKCFALLTDG